MKQQLYRVRLGLLGSCAFAWSCAATGGGNTDGGADSGRDGGVEAGPPATDGGGMDASDVTMVADASADQDAPASTDDGVVDTVNPIPAENAREGTDDWRLAQPADHREVEGYASTTSTVAGQHFDLHVNVNEPHGVSWQAYRLGYYQDHGGRLVASGGPQRVVPQANCPVDGATGAIECRWGRTFSINPDASWVTGEYLIKLVRDDGYDAYVPMIVRESTHRAPVLFQASVHTWQAYNDWGGTSLYVNRLPPSVFTGPHAYRVSYDRPYPTDDTGSGQLRWWEIDMVHFLEKQGYDVGYVTNVDVDATPDVLLNRRLFMTVGHDEYWTTTERNAVEHARDTGVSLAFFSADTGVWNVRSASSTAGEAGRQIVCYKLDEAPRDPDFGTPSETTRFRLPPISRPENSLMGVMYAQYTGGVTYPMIVRDPTHWIFEGTGVVAGETLEHIVGSEWDRVHTDGITPAGLEVVTDSPGMSIEGIVEPSNSTVYYPTATSFVFASGTLTWARALSRPELLDRRIQRMTDNILSRAGVPPATPTSVPPLAPPDHPGTAASVMLLAGSGTPGYLDGPAASARFNAPAGVAAGADGSVYVTDSRNHRVRVIRADGTVSTLAGCGPTDVSASGMYSDGTGSDACFDLPTGVAVGADGTVYVSDSQNNRIRAITPSGVVTTYAGSGDAGCDDSTDRLSATFALPNGLAFGPDGALYVADVGNGAVRRVTASGVTTVLLGLNNPAGLAVGPDGTIYTTNAGDGTLTSIASTQTLLAGSPFDYGDAEGTGDVTRLRVGDGVAVLGDRLVFSDSQNFRVRSYALDGSGLVSTLVGNGRFGAGVGTGSSTQVVIPRGIATYLGGLVIADSANHRVLFARP